MTRATLRPPSSACGERLSETLEGRSALGGRPHGRFPTQRSLACSTWFCFNLCLWETGKPDTKHMTSGADIEGISPWLDRSSTAICLADRAQEDTPLVYVNGRFCELTGYDAHEVVGRNCRFLQGDGTEKAAVASLREAVISGEDSVTCLLNYRKDGTQFHNLLFMSAVPNIDDRDLILGCQFAFRSNTGDPEVQTHFREIQTALSRFRQFAPPGSAPILESMATRSQSAKVLIQAYLSRTR